MQCCKTHFNTIQLYTNLYNSVQGCNTLYDYTTWNKSVHAVQLCITLYNFVQHYTMLHNALHLCTTLYNAVQLCRVLYNSVLKNFVQDFISLLFYARFQDFPPDVQLHFFLIIKEDCIYLWRIES